MLEFCFLFRFWRMYSHQHVILHLPTKFRSNPENQRRSYDVITNFQMAAIKSEIYFRVQVQWWHLFKKVEIYFPVKCRWDISIHGWDKNTSGFGNRTDAILEFYFWFRFWRTYSNRHFILHLPAKCRTIGGGVMTSYRFFNMAAIEWEMYFRVQV